MRIRRGLVYVAVILLAASTFGCGGGGGGGGTAAPTGIGNSLPPATGPGDVENFFPGTQASTYLVTKTDSTTGTPSAYMDSLTITGTKQINGQTAAVLLDSNPDGSGIPIESYYLKNDGGVALLGNNDPTDTITAALVPYIEALFPLTPGVVAQFTKNGIDFGADVDGDGIHETLNVTLTNTIDGFEPLSLGVGSFARTLKRTDSLTGNVILSASKVSIPISSAQTSWSAPGIGVLSFRANTTAQSATLTQNGEARGYNDNGVMHGFALPSTVASNLPLSVQPIGDAPALATDGTNFLATSMTGSGLVGYLFDAQGTVANSVNIASGTGSVAPVAAFDGTNYWVVYSPYSNDTSGSITSCLAKRVSPTGTLIDATAINLVTVGGSFASIGSKAFVFGSTNGLLVFSTFNQLTYQHELHGVLVNPDGTVAVGEFPIATDNSTHLYPAVAFDGTNFFVVWEQLASSGATIGSIYGVRVSTAGSVVDPAPFAISAVSNGQFSPSVAFDGTNYLVTWLDLRSNNSGDIYGARVTTAGVLLDGPSTSGGFVISSGGTLGRSPPKVAFSGTEYLVTWDVLGYANSGALGVLAARVSTAGTLPSGPNLAIPVSGPPSATIGSQVLDPAIAAGAQRGAVVWFENQSTTKLLKAAMFSPF